jgi:hypothetical protein
METADCAYGSSQGGLESMVLTTPLRIVVTEYPKCGGTWVVSMLGDALALPRRDIYVSDGYTLQDLRNHPWYLGAASLDLTDSCVIKSHELPKSPLLEFPARYLHLVRDGRDVVASRYFFEKEFCVKNGLRPEFDEPFEEYVVRVGREWARYVSAWLNVGTPLIRYEQFLGDPADGVRRALSMLELPVDETRIAAAVAANTKEVSRQRLAKVYAHNTFVRRAAAGDWRNHFSAHDERRFEAVAGAMLASLGYD